MKIDFSIDRLSGGGAERVMATIVNALVENHAVRLITFNDGDKYEISNRVERIKLHQGAVRNHTLRSIFNLFRFYRTQNTKPDVLISFMPPNGLVAIVIGIILKIDVIVSEHINHSSGTTGKNKFIQKYFYRFAKYITVLTSFDVEHFSKMGARVQVMPNPINVPGRNTPLLKRSKTILMVGSLDRYHQKGFDAFLPIVAPILKNNPEWVLKIIGSGETGLAHLKGITNELHIENQIDFAGFCNNVYEIMQNCQIFVLPSRFEGLPMGLMEALSNGMVCIAYDCVTGPSELINDNSNGLLIENQNSQSMQEGMKRLLENDELRSRLADKAPESMQKYTIPHIRDQWEVMFSEVKAR